MLSQALCLDLLLRTCPVISRRDSARAKVPVTSQVSRPAPAGQGSDSGGVGGLWGPAQPLPCPGVPGGAKAPRLPLLLAPVPSRLRLRSEPPVPRLTPLSFLV